MGGNVQQLPVFNHTALCNNAVAQHVVPHSHIVFQIYKIHVVPERHYFIFLVKRQDSGRTVDVFKFLKSRMRRSVRIYQTVHAEIAVVGMLVMVAPISVHLFSVYGLSHINGMVAPLPDKTSARAVVLLNHLEIILQIAGAVAHGMAVLAHDERLCAVFLKIGMDIIQSRIHPAVGVQIIKIIFTLLCSVKSAFIVRQAGGVKLLCPCERLLKGTAVSAFVSHGPDNHAGAVLIPLHTALRSVNGGRGKFRIIRDCLAPALKPFGNIGIAEKHVFPSRLNHLFPACHFLLYVHFFHINIVGSVALIVRLFNHIKAKLVVKLVCPGRVGIMAGADSIHIVLFHQLQIL